MEKCPDIIVTLKRMPEDPDAFLITLDRVSGVQKVIATRKLK
jgi:hypothetical protein